MDTYQLAVRDAKPRRGISMLVNGITTPEGFNVWVMQMKDLVFWNKLLGGTLVQTSYVNLPFLDETPMSDTRAVINYEKMRVERDGKVAVVLSGGYGAGWSTWVHRNVGVKLKPLTDPFIVMHILGEKFMTKAQWWAVANRYDSSTFRRTESSYVSDATTDHEDDRSYMLHVDRPKMDVIRDVMVRVSQLCLMWIPLGRKFRIDEYDGSERVVYLDEESYEEFV